MQPPFGQLSSARAWGKQLWFGTRTCGTDTFEHLMGTEVGWVPTSAWPPAPQGTPLWGTISPAHAPQGCHLLDLPVIALLFLPLNKYPFSRCEAKWARKTVVGTEETYHSQGNACPTCVGSAGPKSCFLEVFVEEGG